jgi:hypothetical protein
MAVYERPPFKGLPFTLRVQQYKPYNAYLSTPERDGKAGIARLFLCIAGFNPLSITLTLLFKVFNVTHSAKMLRGVVNVFGALSHQFREKG